MPATAKELLSDQQYYLADKVKIRKRHGLELTDIHRTLTCSSLHNMPRSW